MKYIIKANSLPCYKVSVFGCSGDKIPVNALFEVSKFAPEPVGRRGNIKWLTVLLAGTWQGS